jgi:hypothetical protein
MIEDIVKTEITSEEKSDFKEDAANYYSKYNDEVRRHDETKRALSKAIKLANLLLDEVTLSEERKHDAQVSQSKIMEL